MISSCKCSCGPSLFLLRNICIYSALECNHYKVLGLSPSATQAEIKSAFYELSKKHHPDKNQGCEESEKKFKDITNAYEVLRSEKHREKYDRQIFTNQSSEYYAARSGVDYNDEAERSFYEKTSRIKRRKYYGKTKQFDYDVWYKAHYGNPSVYVYSSGDFRYRYTGQNEGPSKSFNKMLYTIYILSGGCIILLSYNFFKKKNNI